MTNHIRLFHAVMVLASLRLCAYTSETLLLENECFISYFSAHFCPIESACFIAVRDLSSLRSCADSLEPSLRKIRLTKIRCLYPEGGRGSSSVLGHHRPDSFANWLNKKSVAQNSLDKGNV